MKNGKSKLLLAAEPRLIIKFFHTKDNKEYCEKIDVKNIVEHVEKGESK